MKQLTTSEINAALKKMKPYLGVSWKSTNTYEVRDVRFEIGQQLDKIAAGNADDAEVAATLVLALDTMETMQAHQEEIASKAQRVLFEMNRLVMEAE